MPDSLPLHTYALAGKHGKARSTTRWFTSESRAPHCRSATGLFRARALANRNRMTPKHSSRVTCAPIDDTNTIPHKIMHQKSPSNTLMRNQAVERNGTERRTTRFPSLDPILTGTNRTREQNNNKCAWDARCIMCTWVASQLNTIY